MKKQKLVNLLLAVVLLLLGVLPLLLYRQKARISGYSIPALCLLGCHLLTGVMAYLLRHKHNYLRFSPNRFRHAPFNFWQMLAPDREYTFTEEYQRKFYGSLAVHFAFVPLYLPCIFLTSSMPATLTALWVFLLPQMVFAAADLRTLFADIKKEKQRRLQLERERIEQERREELGHWK